jgi:hypothetical protein
MSSIQDIISQITDAGGLARPTLYSVQIIPPRIFSSTSSRAANDFAFENAEKLFADRRGEPVQNAGLRFDYFKELGIDNSEMYTRLNLMCQRAELPGISFSTSDSRTYGSYFKTPYVDTYGDLPLEFIVGRDLAERRFFDAWRYTIQDPETADFNYIDEYASVIDIFQMDEYDNATYGVRFFQAWPLTIGAMHLGYDQRNQYHVLPVTFTYRKWISLDVNTNTPTSIRSAGGSPQPFEQTIRKESKVSPKSGCAAPPKPF